MPGVYGTLGTADAANIPGGRHQSLSWRDSSGNLWLFGGYGVGSDGTSGQLNDLWKFDPTQGASGKWTWMGGTNVAPISSTGGANGSPGVYGTLGVAAATNMPGGREQTTSWIDASGAVWIFGGEGIDVNGVTGELNDLWKFDPKAGVNGEWTWMGGSDSVGSALAFGGPPGVYGTLGASSPTNVPGGRYGAVSWMDAKGNLWLFGGSGIDSAGFNGNLPYLNDLWKYTPGAGGSAGEWTWMGGPDVAPASPTPGGPKGAPGVYGTQGTAASTNYPGGRDAPMSWIDASGNLWIFGGLGIDSAGNFGYLNDLWKYTPTKTGDAGQWTWVSGSSTLAQANAGPSGVYGSLGMAASTNVPGGRFSGANWVDASGNLWLFGGQGFDSEGSQGILNDLWKFDPAKGQWTWESGSSTVGGTGGQPGVYGTLGTPATTNVPGGRFGIPTWTDASGNLWLFGGMGYDSTGAQGYLNDLWKY
ncbi:Hypothetical protein A7982_13168 [Minicystis rosea]|nr:Hypothetical protein A7982_13168 [Minicystis rosea]